MCGTPGLGLLPRQGGRKGLSWRRVGSTVREACLPASQADSAPPCSPRACTWSQGSADDLHKHAGPRADRSGNEFAAGRAAGPGRCCSPDGLRMLRHLQQEASGQDSKSRAHKGPSVQGAQMRHGNRLCRLGSCMSLCVQRPLPACRSSGSAGVLRRAARKKQNICFLSGHDSQTGRLGGSRHQGC